MKRKIHSLCILLLLAMLCAMGSGLAEAAAVPPLLDPTAAATQTIATPDTITILLLGVDFGHRGYWGSDTKKQQEICHADAMLAVAIHPEAHAIDLISFPSETLAYVPGVKGVYRLNAAINCGTDMQDGLSKQSDAISWMLGGIQVPYCCAIDMNAMEAIGDAIGGVEFQMDMNYRGHSGTRYRKGMQHLDGMGIVDYLRSCGNATVTPDDIGRTGRQRALMTALFDKLTAQPALLLKAIGACVGSDGFFTNIPLDGALMRSVLDIILAPEPLTVGSYVLDGEYRKALGGWHFIFTDQANRQAILRTVYGVDAPVLPYVDYGYTQWLADAGLRAAHALGVADALIAYLAADTGTQSDQCLAAVQTFRTDRDALALAFRQAAQTMDKQDTRAMTAARKALQSSAAKAAKLMHYPKKLTWSISNSRWTRDPYINQVSLNWQ